MVSDIKYLSPLGKSDYCVLHLQFICYTQLKLNKRIRMCYDKGNYEEFNKAISDTEWKSLLNWTKFHDKIRELKKRFVPSRQVKQTTKRKSNYPIDKKTLEKIKEKHALCRKSINSKDPNVRMKYNKVRNQVKNLTNKLKRKYEQTLSSNAKKNPKAIWKYIKAKSKTRTGIGEQTKVNQTLLKLMMIKKKRKYLQISSLAFLQKNQMGKHQP